MADRYGIRVKHENGTSGWITVKDCKVAFQNKTGSSQGSEANEKRSALLMDMRNRGTRPFVPAGISRYWSWNSTTSTAVPDGYFLVRL